jgi:hypothetical protein
MRFASAGPKSRKIVTQHFIVFYDPADGRIRHLHTVHVVEGGRHVDRAEAEREAEERARQYGLDPGRHKKLYVTEFPPQGAVRVDLETERLIPLEKHDLPKLRRPS